MICYVYKRAGGATWAVGYYDPAGRWFGETLQPDPELAALRVRWLHGGSMPPSEVFAPAGPGELSTDPGIPLHLPKIIRKPWFYWGMPK
jgi:hypothetical protein